MCDSQDLPSCVWPNSWQRIEQNDEPVAFQGLWDPEIDPTLDC